MERRLLGAKGDVSTRSRMRALPVVPPAPLPPLPFLASLALAGAATTRSHSTRTVGMCSVGGASVDVGVGEFCGFATFAELFVSPGHGLIRIRFRHCFFKVWEVGARVAVGSRCGRLGELAVEQVRNAVGCRTTKNVGARLHHAT